MAHPAFFWRLQVIGTGYPGETWSWSLSFINNDPDPGTTRFSEVPAGLIDAVKTFHSNTYAYVHQAAKLTTIKFNLIGYDGRYVSETDTVVYDYPTPVAGASTAAAPPPQQALAISLVTDAKRGLASRGRFYPPYFAGTLDAATGLVSTSNATATRGAAVTLIQACNTAVGPEWACGVTSAVGNGEQRPVTGVRVGRAVDTIRRRRRQLEEGYTPTAPV